ncbi:MAG: 4'-phosphopantetheinyl transferase [Xanthobacteraceae bacterium]
MTDLRVPGVLIGQRAIAAGDERRLLPAELPMLARSVEKVRRASGAARALARELLVPLGHEGWPILKAQAGAPIWPPGIVGSLAHDDKIAMAALARRDDVAGLGIDVEPAEMLPADVLELVTTAQERRRISDDPCGGRLIFVAKEAVYKAVYPLDRIFLEHHDVEVSLHDGKARVCNGRVVDLRLAVSTHLMALAWIGV